MLGVLPAAAAGFVVLAIFFRAISLPFERAGCCGKKPSSEGAAQDSNTAPQRPLPQVPPHTQGMTKNVVVSSINIYCPHSEGCGRVMFSVCLFRGYLLSLVLFGGGVGANPGLWFLVLSEGEWLPPDRQGVPPDRTRSTAQNPLAFTQGDFLAGETRLSSWWQNVTISRHKLHQT